MRTCVICKKDHERSYPYCYHCDMQRVFTTYQVNRASFEFWGRGEVDAILYSGKRIEEARQAMESKTDELRRAGQEHYYLFIADQHGNQVCSVSR